ncbi:MAG: bestrophin family protein [Chitinophagaceae bacterium]
MLLKKNLGLHRIFLITWKTDIVMLILTSLAYVIDVYLFPEIFVPPSVAALMGTALAFFIGFNNNQAYGRWWEARIIWGGFINDSRTLCRNLTAYLKPDTKDDQAYIKNEIIREIVYRHIGFLYLLKDSLRKINTGDYKKYLSEEDLRKISGVTFGYNAVMDIQFQQLGELYKQGKLDGFQLMALNTTLTNISNDMGRSERINNTVFPPTYIYFTELFIYLLTILITLTTVQAIGPWSIFFGWIIGFVYHTTHINGLSIMNPFEMLPSSIPLSSITRTIEINLLESLGINEVPPPEPTYENGEYIL